MTAVEFPRRELLASLQERIGQGPPFVVTGPPGAGKTTLLGALAVGLAENGWTPVYLDLMGAASSPERFVDAALAALGDGLEGRASERAQAARRLAGGGKARGAEAVQALFSLWSSLGELKGRPLALLLDEATEIRSLAYFSGLREVHRPFGAALGARPRGTVLVSSFPGLARKSWPQLPEVEVPPLTLAEVRPALAGRPYDGEALLRASFGWPRYARALLEEMADGADPASAWAAGMAHGGRLETACRQTYESLLLRSRGYGMSKAVLAAVAAEEGLNLTALVSRLGRTPGAVRDYLGWLLAVDALRAVKKRYYYVDGMLRLWVRLYTRGTLPTPAGIRTTADELLGSGDAPPPPRRRADGLMEID